MCIHLVFEFLIVFVDVPFEKLLQYCDYVRLKVALTTDCVNYCAAVNFTCCVQRLTLKIFDIPFVYRPNKVHVLDLYEFSENLDVFVELFDCLVSVDDFCIHHGFIDFLP